MYEWHFIIISFNSTPVFGCCLWPVIGFDKELCTHALTQTHSQTPIRNGKKLSEKKMCVWKRDKRFKHWCKQMHCIYILKWLLFGPKCVCVCAYPHQNECAIFCECPCVFVLVSVWEIWDEKWKWTSDCFQFVCWLSLLLFSLSSIAFYLRLHSQVKKKSQRRTCRPTNQLTTRQTLKKMNKIEFIRTSASRMKSDGRFFLVEGKRVEEQGMSLHVFFFFKCKWSFMLFNLKKNTERNGNECVYIL